MIRTLRTSPLPSHPAPPPPTLADRCMLLLPGTSVAAAAARGRGIAAVRRQNLADHTHIHFPTLAAHAALPARHPLPAIHVARCMLLSLLCAARCQRARNASWTSASNQHFADSLSLVPSSRFFRDVTFLVGERKEKISAHRIVLAARYVGCHGSTSGFYVSVSTVPARAPRFSWSASTFHLH